MPPPPPGLRHIPLGHIPYLHASVLQSRLVDLFLLSKSSPETHAPPPPTVLTASFPPVYTLGRREKGTLTAQQSQHLLAGGKASYYPALRGGQTTFHGPGQLVAYPIVDLRQHGITPKCYIRTLENSIIATLQHWDIRAMTTENTGVWTSENEKIAAVGVHMRRFITSHGIALNVNTDLWWFDRIVACGLPGKSATSFEKEGVSGVEVEDVAEKFVEILAERLGCPGVERKALAEVEGLRGLEMEASFE
ncbi:hypothetical protein RUND412_009753 [Rhizina undulata]